MLTAPPPSVVVPVVVAKTLRAALVSLPTRSPEMVKSVMPEIKPPLNTTLSIVTVPSVPVEETMHEVAGVCDDRGVLLQDDRSHRRRYKNSDSDREELPLALLRHACCPAFFPLRAFFLLSCFELRFSCARARSPGPAPAFPLAPAPKPREPAPRRLPNWPAASGRRDGYESGDYGGHMGAKDPVRPTRSCLVFSPAPSACRQQHAASSARPATLSHPTQPRRDAEGVGAGAYVLLQTLCGHQGIQCCLVQTGEPAGFRAAGETAAAAGRLAGC